MELDLIRTPIYFLKMNLIYGGESQPFTLMNIMKEWAEIWGSFSGNDEEQQCYLIKIL